MERCRANGTVPLNQWGYYGRYTPTGVYFRQPIPGDTGLFLSTSTPAPQSPEELLRQAVLDNPHTQVTVPGINSDFIRCANTDCPHTVLFAQAAVVVTGNKDKDKIAVPEMKKCSRCRIVQVIHRHPLP